MLKSRFSGTPTEIFVPLTSDQEYLIVKNFMEENMSRDDAESRRSSVRVWYGIIDGCHFHEYIMELCEEITAIWERFSWTVIVVKPHDEESVYRQI